MSIGGGLIQEDFNAVPVRHSGYTEAGDQFIVLPNGIRLAQEWKNGDAVPEGHVVINIEYGDDMTDTGPVPVTVGDNSLCIPRNTDRVVPVEHMNVLSDAVETTYFQKDLLSQMIPKHTRRFKFNVVKWSKTGETTGTTIQARDDATDRHEVIELDQ